MSRPARRSARLPDDAAATTPPAARQLAGLLLLSALVGTVNGLSRVALPLFAASLGAPAWQVGLVGGLGYAGMLTLALPMGAWIDRHGTRAPFVRGVLVAAVFYALLSQATRPWQAVAGAAVLGLVLPFGHSGPHRVPGAAAAAVGGQGGLEPRCQHRGHVLRRSGAGGGRDCRRGLQARVPAGLCRAA